MVHERRLKIQILAIIFRRTRIHQDWRKILPVIYKRKYNIDCIIAYDSYVYCEAIQGMYSLKQAAQLGRGQLVETLKPFGYYPIKECLNIWAHTQQDEQNSAYVLD